MGVGAGVYGLVGGVWACRGKVGGCECRFGQLKQTIVSSQALRRDAEVNSLHSRGSVLCLRCVGCVHPSLQLLCARCCILLCI